MQAAFLTILLLLHDILAVGTVVPAVAGTPIVVASTAVANAAGVVGAAAVDCIFAVAGIHDDEYTIGLKEIAGSPNHIVDPFMDPIPIRAWIQSGPKTRTAILEGSG